MPQHEAQTPAMAGILAAHKSNGLAYNGNIQYQWIIGEGWEAQGNPDNQVGYHAGNWLANLSSVAICMMGNFQTDTLTDYQKERLVAKINFYMAKYGLSRSAIRLHRDFTATACPGLHIDKPLIFSLLDSQGSTSDEAIKILFRKIWKREPATGEWKYFVSRLQKGTLKAKDLESTITYWSQQPDSKWQIAKQKELA